MKTPLISLISVGVVLAASCFWCEAAPRPAHLSEIATLEVGSPSFSLTFSPDGKTLFARAGSRRARVREGIWLWDVASRKHIATFERDPEKEIGFSWIVLSPNGEMAACLCSRNTIVLWDVARRKRLGYLEDDQEVYSVVFSPDGKTLSAQARDSLRIWDVEKRKRVRTCETHGLLRPVSAYSSIKTPLLVDTTVIRRRGAPDESDPFALVDAFTGVSVLTCEVEKRGGIPMSFAINPAETIVASSGLNSPVRLWDRATGKSIAIFKPSATSLGGLAFSPDGRILASGFGSYGFENSLLLLEVPSGKILADLKGYGIARSLAFSPDGRLLAIDDSRDIRHGNIKLWSIPEKWRKEK